MKILFLSQKGDGLGVADRLAQEGHDVRFWTHDLFCVKDLSGIVARIDTWRPSVTWCDLCISDLAGFARFREVFEKYGKPTLGLNPVTELLELDDGKLEATARVLGIPLSGSQRDDDVTLSIEGWFNGVSWITPSCVSFKETRLMPGGTGPCTQSMGAVLLPVRAGRLQEATLDKMTNFLRRAGYRGPVGMTLEVGSDEACLVHFKASMSYDESEAFATGLKEPLGGFLFEVATGTKKEIELTKGCMVAVRLCEGPYPFAVGSGDCRTVLGGVIPENRKYIFFSGVLKRGDQYVTTDSSGVVAKITATGRSIAEGRARAYRTIRNISGADLFYRPDIGSRVERDVSELKEWGWI